MAWEYQTVLSPIKGLNTDIPSTMIGHDETPKVQNFRFYKGYIEKAKGAPTFGNTTASPLGGTPMAFGDFHTYRGTHYHWALTANKIYEIANGGATLTDRTANAFTSNIDHPFSVLPFIDRTYEDKLIITNGTDHIRIWTGGGNESYATNLLGTYICKWLQYYGDRVCMYNVRENGSWLKQRIRWSNTANDLASWTESGAGFKDLYAELNDGDEILRAEPLGADIIVYGSTSIAVQSYREDVTYPFPTSEACAAVGLGAARAIANIDGCEHVFLGHDGRVYSYTGGNTVEALDKGIQYDLQENLNMQYIGRSFMVYIPEIDTIRLFVPLGTDTVPNTYYELNRSTACSTPGRCDPSWTKGTVPDFSGAGDLTHSSNKKRYKMYGRKNGEVYRSIESGLNWGTAPIDAYFDTKDFVADPGYRRTLTNWMSLAFEGYGDEVEIKYSTNGGASYVALETVALTGTWEMYRVDFEVNGSQCRFRFGNGVTSHQCRIREFEPAFIRASDRGV